MVTDMDSKGTACTRELQVPTQSLCKYFVEPLSIEGSVQVNVEW